MKKFYIYIIFFIFFSGCTEGEFGVYKVPYEVDIYVQDFLNEASKRGHNYEINNIEVVWSESMEYHAKIKKTGLFGKITLTISRPMWEAYEDYYYRRQAIIFHEFGHQPIGRDHIEKESLMNINTFSSTIAKYHQDEVFRERLIDELFN